MNPLINIVGIHPIVILTISDFYNRMRVTSNGKVKRVFGALMGLKTGTKVEIFSAFEFSNQSPEPDKIDLDIQYIDTRRDLATQLFPKLDIIGFFSTNDSITPNEKDREILKAMTYFGVITPVYLVLSTNVEKASELPIGVYDIDKTKKTFNKVNHVIEGWESERICLETVTKTAEIGNDQSGLIQNLQTTKNALNVLKENLDLIKKNMKKFEKDEKFKEMLEDLLINYPNANESDYEEMIAEKQKEVFILNNICAGTIENSYLGKTNSLNKDMFTDAYY